MRRAAGLANRFVGENDQLRMKRSRRYEPEPFPRDIDVAFGGESGRRLASLEVHPRERRGIEVPLIERDSAFFHHARHDPRLRRAGADRAHAPAASRGDGVDLLGHLRSRQEGVAAAVHRRGARVSGLAAKCDRVSHHAEGAEHGTERQVEVEEHRPLLDVEFQVGGGVRPLAPALPHALEIDAHVPQGVGQRHSLLVGESPRLIEIEVAGAGGRAKQALAEPRPFLVGPVHHADRDRRFSFVLRAHPPQHLQTRQQSEATVEPTAVGHRVDVAADHNGPFARARERRPDIPGGVFVHLHRQAGEPLAKPCPGRKPHRREGHPLGAVGVCCEGPEVL